MKIYVSPSSQSANIGVGTYGKESDRMQALSDLLVPLLEDAGHTVYGGNNSLTLSERIAASNNADVDLHVALHSNAGGGSGPETWYYTSSTNGQSLAQKILTKLKAISGAATGRTIKSSTSLIELSQTSAVATIVEVAFHDNQTDVNWMLAHWSDIAQAICNGIEEY